MIYDLDFELGRCFKDKPEDWEIIKTLPAEVVPLAVGDLALFFQMSSG